jgi:DNA-binding MarR family transcriptional regulator
MTKKTIFAFEQPEENAGFLLWQVSMLWQLKMKKGLDTVNLTLTQFALLAALHWLTHEGATVTQNDLANHAKLDKMTTSKVLRTLADKGFVERAEHAHDTRAKTIVLTKTGVDVLTQANAIVAQTDQQFFSRLGKNEGVYKEMMQDLLVKSTFSK